MRWLGVWLPARRMLYRVVAEECHAIPIIVTPELLEAAAQIEAAQKGSAPQASRKRSLRLGVGFKGSVQMMAGLL